MCQLPLGIKATIFLPKGWDVVCDLCQKEVSSMVLNKMLKDSLSMEENHGNKH